MPRSLINSLALTLLFALSCLPALAFAQAFESGWVEFVDGGRIDVEIATNQNQREHGLMHRPALATNQGMLFVYPTERRQAMWMKNTLIPLDVLFISEQGKIVSIQHRLEPCRSQPCTVYFSNGKAKYMLEVNAGLAEQQHLEVGQDVLIDYKHP